MRLIRVSILLCLALLIFPTLAFAKEWDTHYVLTYILARKVGYTQDEAQRIASADAAIDLASNKGTEPLQLLQILNPWGDAQTPRGRFHAFLDSRTYNEELEIGGPQAALEAAIEEREERAADLWDQAVSTGNPGPYLHFVEDLPTHEGFYTSLGHLIAGNRQDYLGVDQAADKAMIENTIKVLQYYRRDVMHQEPNDVSREDWMQVYNDLVASNPPPFSNDGLNPFAWIRDAWNNWVAWIYGGGIPDHQKALDAIMQNLPERTVPPSIKFALDKDGNPIDPTAWRITEGHPSANPNPPPLPNPTSPATSPVGTDCAALLATYNATLTAEKQADQALSQVTAEGDAALSAQLACVDACPTVECKLSCSVWDAHQRKWDAAFDRSMKSGTANHDAFRALDNSGCPLPPP